MMASSLSLLFSPPLGSLVVPLHAPVEGLEVTGYDRDGEGEDQDPRHGAHGSYQLP